MKDNYSWYVLKYKAACKEFKLLKYNFENNKYHEPDQVNLLKVWDWNFWKANRTAYSSLGTLLNAHNMFSTYSDCRMSWQNSYHCPLKITLYTILIMQDDSRSPKTTWGKFLIAWWGQGTAFRSYFFLKHKKHAKPSFKCGRQRHQATGCAEVSGRRKWIAEGSLRNSWERNVKNVGAAGYYIQIKVEKLFIKF